MIPAATVCVQGQKVPHSGSLPVLPEEKAAHSLDFPEKVSHSGPWYSDGVARSGHPEPELYSCCHYLPFSSPEMHAIFVIAWPTNIWTGWL